MKKLILLCVIFIIVSCSKIVLNYEEILVLKNANVKELKLDRVIVKYKDRDKIQVIKDVKDVNKELEKLNNNEKVEYAEPDYIIEHCVFPNDSLYNVLWNMQNGYGCGAINQWNKVNLGDTSIYVAIIDQGYWIDHPDLKHNVGKNPFEIPNNGIDDDNNGYIDDVYGWDFWNNDNTVNDAEDMVYHATHVAGIIGAMGNNTIGVVGVIWNVKLFSAKFIYGNSGYTSDAILAIDYITNLKKEGMNIIAVNNSWGLTSKSKALEAAMNRAEQAGLLMVCAAGNDGSNKVIFPAAYTNDNIISVASINSKGNLSSFSNYNKRLVDIAAPGEYIMSTYYTSLWGNTEYYDYLSGTSMATPHVAGAVALYYSLHHAATWQEAKQAILDNSIPTPSLVGKCVTAGRLDVTNF